jgi:hypothetical protein
MRYHNSLLLKEALEQYNGTITVIYKGITIILSQHLEWKLLKYSSTSILNDNGYNHYFLTRIISSDIRFL